MAVTLGRRRTYLGDLVVVVGERQGSSVIFRWASGVGKGEEGRPAGGLTNAADPRRCRGRS